MMCKVTTRWGVSIEEMGMPVFYNDNSIIKAIYSASTEQVFRYLPDPMMYPLEITPGRCLVSFTASEYHQTDIGLYNEFSIAYLISYGRKCIPALSVFSERKDKCFDMYVHHMPVTTETARIGGVETYGYPKILAGIAFNRAGGVTECSVSVNKKHILTLTAPELETGPGKTVRIRHYAVRKGTTLCGNVYRKHHEYAETTETDNVILSIGEDHEICRTLKSLELSSRAVMYQYIPSSESIRSIPSNNFEI